MDGKDGDNEHAGGRQNAARALAEELAGVARLDYTGVLGLTVGGSAYLGNSGQNRTVTTTGGSVDLGARTLIWEGHLTYQWRGLDLRGRCVNRARQLRVRLRRLGRDDDVGAVGGRAFGDSQTDAA